GPPASRGRSCGSMAMSPMAMSLIVMSPMAMSLIVMSPMAISESGNSIEHRSLANAAAIVSSQFLMGPPHRPFHIPGTRAPQPFAHAVRPGIVRAVVLHAEAAPRQQLSQAAALEPEAVGVRPPAAGP